MRISIILCVLFFACKGFSQNTSKVTIHVELFNEYMQGNLDEYNEWLDYEITTANGQIVLFEESIVLKAFETHDRTFCFEEGNYRLNIIDMGAYVKNPTITLSDGSEVAWGYPAYQYFSIEIDEELFGSCNGTVITDKPVVPITTPPDTNIIDTNNNVVNDTVLPKPISANLDFEVFTGQGKLNLALNIGEEQELQVIATDFLGNQIVLLENQLKTKGRHNEVLAIENLKSGVYFVTVLSNGVRITKTIRIK